MPHAEFLARLCEAMSQQGFHELTLSTEGWSCRLVIDPQEACAAPGEGHPQQRESLPAPARPEEAVSPVAPLRVAADRVGIFRMGKKLLVPGLNVGAGEIVGTIKGISAQDHVVAPQAGVVLSVDIRDGEIVEFGRLLFTMDPSPAEGK